MSKGTVKYFNDTKGWGIIHHSDFNQDVYVHYTSINMPGYKTLREGQEVLFELVKSDRGAHADNVILLN
ncbi:MAG: cold shock domain-containing protein [candidate division Zixibacteria bacterium]|nr:cold shock domain-containing protein [candidate division Zixibacteria bacterium]